MKHVALYARVSTPQQEKQGPIASKVAALTAYAAAHGLAIAPEHQYLDDGYSGARLDRPGLERLRDAVWRGELDSVLILAPDRLARHYAYQYVVVEELERAGCAVVFINGPFNDSPEERLVREVHGLFAEFERAAFQERGRRGKLHAARQGAFLHGRRPLRLHLSPRARWPARAVRRQRGGGGGRAATLRVAGRGATLHLRPRPTADRPGRANAPRPAALVPLQRLQDPQQPPLHGDALL